MAKSFRDKTIEELRAEHEAVVRTAKQGPHWTVSQIENFLRHETMKSDDACKKLARTLASGNLLNLILRCNPEDYTDQIE